MHLLFGGEAQRARRAAVASERATLLAAAEQRAAVVRERERAEAAADAAEQRRRERLPPSSPSEVVDALLHVWRHRVQQEIIRDARQADDGGGRGHGTAGVDPLAHTAPQGDAVRVAWADRSPAARTAALFRHVLTRGMWHRVRCGFAARVGGRDLCDALRDWCSPRAVDQFADILWLRGISFYGEPAGAGADADADAAGDNLNTNHRGIHTAGGRVQSRASRTTPNTTLPTARTNAQEPQGGEGDTGGGNGGSASSDGVGPASPEGRCPGNSIAGDTASSMLLRGESDPLRPARRKGGKSDSDGQGIAGERASGHRQHHHAATQTQSHAIRSPSRSRTPPRQLFWDILHTSATSPTLLRASTARLAPRGEPAATVRAAAASPKPRPSPPPPPPQHQPAWNPYTARAASLSVGASSPLALLTAGGGNATPPPRAGYNASTSSVAGAAATMHTRTPSPPVCTSGVGGAGGGSATRVRVARSTSAEGHRDAGGDGVGAAAPPKTSPPAGPFPRPCEATQHALLIDDAPAGPVCLLGPRALPQQQGARAPASWAVADSHKGLAYSNEGRTVQACVTSRARRHLVVAACPPAADHSRPPPHTRTDRPVYFECDVAGRANGTTLGVVFGSARVVSPCLGIDAGTYAVQLTPSAAGNVGWRETPRCSGALGDVAHNDRVSVSYDPSQRRVVFRRWLAHARVPRMVLMDVDASHARGPCRVAALITSPHVALTHLPHAAAPHPPPPSFHHANSGLPTAVAPDAAYSPSATPDHSMRSMALVAIHPSVLQALKG